MAGEEFWRGNNNGIVAPKIPDENGNGNMENEYLIQV